MENFTPTLYLTLLERTERGILHLNLAFTECNGDLSPTDPPATPARLQLNSIS
jgi:hypothetical protein